MIVVSDTSVITSLIQVGHYELLRQLNGAVLIPRAVQLELLRTHATIPAFLDVRDVTDRTWVADLEVECLLPLPSSDEGMRAGVMGFCGGEICG